MNHTIFLTVFLLVLVRRSTTLNNTILFGDDLLATFTDDHVGGVMGSFMAAIDNETLALMYGYSMIGTTNIHYRFGLESMELERWHDELLLDREFDLGTMTPGSLLNFAAVHVPSLHATFIYGGSNTYGGGALNTFYAIDDFTGEMELIFGSITQTYIEPEFDVGNPGSLLGATLVYHEDTNTFYLVGGQMFIDGYKGFSNNIWGMSLDGDPIWEHIAGSKTLNPIPDSMIPGGIAYHNAIVIEDDIVITTGQGVGQNGLVGLQNYVRKWNIFQKKWTKVFGNDVSNTFARYEEVLHPGASYRGNAIPYMEGFILISGYGYTATGYGYLDDIYYFSLRTNKWFSVRGSRKVNSIDATAGHSAEIIGKFLYVFGGQNADNEISNHLTVFELSTEFNDLETEQPSDISSESQPAEESGNDLSETTELLISQEEIFYLCRSRKDTFFIRDNQYRPSSVLQCILNVEISIFMDILYVIDSTIVIGSDATAYVKAFESKNSNITVRDGAILQVEGLLDVQGFTYLNVELTLEPGKQYEIFDAGSVTNTENILVDNSCQNGVQRFVEITTVDNRIKGYLNTAKCSENSEMLIVVGIIVCFLFIIVVVATIQITTLFRV